MKTIAALCSCLAFLVIVQEGPDDHGSEDVQVQRINADTPLLLRELYPTLKVKDDADGKQVVLSGSNVELDGAEALVQGLGDLREGGKTWTLRTVDSFAPDYATYLRRLRPDLFVHVGSSRTLVLIGGSQKDLKEAETMIASLEGATGTASGGSDAVVAGSVAALRAAEGAMAQRLRLGEDGTSRDDLEKLVQAEFDARQKTHEAEIELLKRKVDELEARVRTFRESRQSMIRKRVDALLKDPDLAMRVRESGSGGDASKPRKVRAGDTLGVFIPGVLGKPNESPPIYTDPTGINPPTMGYPLQVRANGTISVPLLGDQKVAGLSINGVEARLKHLLESSQIMKKGRAQATVSMIRRAGTSNPLVSAASANTGSDPVTRQPQAAMTGIGMKTPSQFASALVEISDLAASGNPLAPDNADIRFQALKQEQAVQVARSQRALVAADAAVTKAEEKLSHYHRLHERGYADAASLRAAESALQLAQHDKKLQTLTLDSFRKALPDALPEARKAAPKRPTAMVQPTVGSLPLQILKTPSEFADGFVELGELARSGKGRAGENAVARLRALRAECTLQISLLESALTAAASDFEAKAIIEKQAQRRWESGLAPADEAVRAKAAVESAKQRLLQLEAMRNAYRKVMPDVAARGAGGGDEESGTGEESDRA